MPSSTLASPTAEGYFPPGRSVLRRVMRERAVGLLYGQRALMLGALQPLAFIGTMQRSKAKSSPFRRLVHTATMFDAVFFGSREEADRALAFTARLHDRVKGEIPKAVGPFPAGTPYSAFDPGLMRWVVAPMFDSSQVLYETFVGPLSDAERATLYDEYLLFGELFGMPSGVMPSTHAEFRRWWPEALASEEIFLTDHARAVGRAIGTKLPTPAVFWPAMQVASFLLIGTLPPRAREQYGFSWSRADQLAFQAAALAIRRTRWLVPRAIRRGSSAEAYALVARTERQRLSAGNTSFPSGGSAAPRLPRRDRDLVRD